MFLIKTGDTLPSRDIISTHAVYSEMDCSFKCLVTETCVAYNYRPTSSKYEMNCQLSNKKRQATEIKTNGEWTFYQDVEATVSAGPKGGGEKERGQLRVLHTHVYARKV